MKKTIYTFIICCFTIVPIVKTHAQPGTLDLGFGVGGIVTTIMGDTIGGAYDVAIQPDGKILVAGFGTTGSNRDFAVTRYNIDGSLDATFDSDGKVLTDIGSLYDHINSVTIQTDGKILVVGQTGTPGIPPSYDLGLVRYNSNGSVDNTFGTGGIVITSVGPNGGIGYDVLQLADGKILVAGYYDAFGYDYSFAVMRYNIDGTLDSTFDSDGIAHTAIGIDTNDIARSITVQSDGKILLAGICLNSGGNYDYALVRFNSNGSLDNTFDTDGRVSLDLGSDYDFGRASAIQADGKILMAGYSNLASGDDFALIRYNSNGSLDNTFDADGIVITDIGGEQNVCRSMSIQTDGKILLAGYSVNGADYDFALVRYNSNGSLDNTFGSGGIVTTAIDTSTDYGYSCAIQSDGKIVVAGQSYLGIGSVFAIVRYNGGTLGIGEMDLEGLVKVYPNPADEFVTITLPSTLIGKEISLMNILGQKIASGMITSETMGFDLATLESGIYLININTGSVNFSKKVIRK